MTLHHIKNISPLLKQFCSVLYPSGFLAIADLDLDNGQFHGDNKGSTSVLTVRICAA